MRIICVGRSIITNCVVILSFAVTVNIYNLKLASFNYDNYANRTLLNNNFKMEEFLIILQTILSVLAIVFHKEYTSSGMNLIKFWIFGPLIVTLFFDTVLTTITAFCLLRDKISDTSSKIIELNNEVALTPSSDTTNFFVGAISLFFYFAFKLYTAIIILNYAGSFIGSIARLDDLNDSFLLNNRDIGRNNAGPPSPPPQYEQCV